MPWAPSSAQASGPTEIYVGFCRAGHAVWMSETTPNGAEWKAEGCVRIERLSYWDFKKTKGHCSCTDVNHGREVDVKVKGPKPIDPAPEGTFRAVCVDEVDIGMQPSKYGERAMVMLVWELEELNPKQKNEPYRVYARLGATIGKKSNLGKLLEAWRGRKFEAKDLEEGFDLEKLIGVPCQIQVVHNHVESGETYANVGAIMPIARGMDPLKPSGSYTRVKDREDGGAGEGEPEATGDNDIPF